MLAWAALAWNVIKGLLGIGEKQGDANSTAVLRQAGVDAERVTGLEKSVEIARAQTAAVIEAPTTEPDTIADLRKGGF